MSSAPPHNSGLPPIAYRSTYYEKARYELLLRLIGQELPDRTGRPLQRLQIGDESDWIVAFCDAWGALAEVISFYQERIINEAFLPTAVQQASVARIYHSLGHEFPPNVAATTVIAYHLTTAAAGVEAVGRARRGGAGTSVDERQQLLRTGNAVPGPESTADAEAGASITASEAAAAGAAAVGALGAAAPAGPPTSRTAATTPARYPPAGVLTGSGASQKPSALGRKTQVPPMAQVRAVPGPSGRAPTFVTLEPLSAQVAASRLKVDVHATASAPALEPGTTQLELAGTRTRLAVGQLVLIVAHDAADDIEVQWIRVLTAVTADQVRGSTRVAWDGPLGASAANAMVPVVYGFASSSSLFGSTAPAWSSLTPAAQLATLPADGGLLPVRGGFGRSADGGTSWALQPAGLPAGAPLTSVFAFEDTVVVAAGDAGLLRATGSSPFGPVVMNGPRRFVNFVGGTVARLLAGAGNGSVAQSVDGGMTWSPVSGGPPQLVATPKAAATLVGSGTPAANGPSVATNRIPSVAVRCVIDLLAAINVKPTEALPEVLLAGTDAGLYVYQGGNWTPCSKLTLPVFDLLAVSVDTPPMSEEVVAPSLYAATAEGVWHVSVPDPAKLADATWATAPGSPQGRAYALAKLSGVVYAGSDAGVVPISEVKPQPVEPLPKAVTALFANGSVLLAGTPSRVYRCSPPGAWAPCDNSPVFTLPSSALAPDTPTGKPPATLDAAFAEFGIVFSADAKLTGGDSDFVLTDGGDVFELTCPAGAKQWAVQLQSSLPGVTRFAASGGDVVAVAGYLTTLASEWPGFAVAGNSLELAPPTRNLAPTQPIVIEQQVGAELVAQSLDVTAVAQDSVSGFGTRSNVTRVEFSQALSSGTFPRRATTVWTGASPLALLAPPNVLPAPVTGANVELAVQLSAPLEPGRLASITGSPIGLVVAPLGGSLHLSNGQVIPVGPVQTDVNAIVLDPTGQAFLATSAGVFSVPWPQTGTSARPQLLKQGWPAGPDRTPSSAAAIVLVSNTLLAASSSGVQRSPTSGTPTWTLSGADGENIVALTTNGTSAVACTDKHTVLRCDQPSQPGATWTSVGTADGDVSAVAQAVDGTIFIATASGVWRSEPDSGWTLLRHGFTTAAVDALLVDPEGTVWAGSTYGIQTWVNNEWRRDSGFDHPAGALCLDPMNNVVAAGTQGLFRQGGGSWQVVATVPGQPPSAVAASPDGSFWLGLRAILPLEVAEGQAPVALGHTTVFTGLSVGSGDLEALDQGGVTETILDAFSEQAQPLDTASLVVSGSSVSGYWILRSSDGLFVLALRGAGSTSTLDAAQNGATAYPTGQPSPQGTMRVWPVEVGGVPGTLRARHDLIQKVPAGPDAPVLAETAQVTNVLPTAVPGGGTTLVLDPPLSQVYDPSTMLVNLNVVSAAQGQAVAVPIGTGDAQVSNQSFHVPTPIATIGPTARQPDQSLATSLRVFVDDQQWPSVGSLRTAGPDAHVCAVRGNADGTATVRFGDGQHGARLPSGSSVVASYIQGGGAGNEAAPGAIIQPLDRPQLVSAVHNPLEARVPPIPDAWASLVANVRSLDRVVTLSDYEDVVLAQPGIDSAAAEIVASPVGRALVITVAPAAKAPANLTERVAAALGETAVIGLPARVRLARTVRVIATVRVISPDPGVRDPVCSALSGLTARRPGEPLLAAQVLSTASAVPGVVAARISTWRREDANASHDTALPAAGAAWAPRSPTPKPAELLVLDGRSLTVETTPPVPEVDP